MSLLMEALIHNSIWIALSVLIIFTSMIIFTTILFFKSKKIKEDALVCEKVFLQFLLFFYFVLLSILEILDILHLKYGIISIYFFQSYLAAIYLLNFFIQYENYKSIKDPTIIFRSIIKRYKNNMAIEGIILSTIAIFILLEYFAGITPEEKHKTKIFFSSNIFLVVFMGFISASSIYFYIFNQKNFTNYKLKSKANAVLGNRLKLLMTVAYLSYFLYLIFFQGTSHKLQEHEVFYVISNYMVLIITLFDCIMQMLMIYKSDFYYFTLGNSSMGWLYRICGSGFYKDSLNNSHTDESFSTTDKIQSMKFFHNNLEYPIEEFAVDTFDYILNISLSSLYLVFSEQREDLGSNDLRNAEPNQPAELTKERVKEKDGEQDLTYNTPLMSPVRKCKPQQAETPAEDRNIIIPQDSAGFNITGDYVFIKNTLKNDFKDIKLNTLTNLNFSEIDREDTLALLTVNNIEVRIKSFCGPEFSEIIKNRKIDLNAVKDSLISHYISKNSTSSNPKGEWHSLLGKNSKEEYFKSLKTLILKTYDKALLIEIFDSIIDENRKSYKINVKLHKYLQYLKKNSPTFLPILLGVFKIKINRFQEMVMFVSKNSIVENIPRENFNYWQLMRFDFPGILEKIASSKARSSITINEDIIFQKNIKLSMSNYFHFEAVLKEDLKFLKKIQSTSFGLLIMYYELGQLQHNNKDNNISNYFPDDFGRSSNQNLVNPTFKFSNDNLTKVGAEKTSSIEIDTSISGLKNDISSVPSQEKNYFEACLNNFKCVFFFSFENIFNEGGCCVSKKLYTNYLNDIKGNFEESRI